MDKVIEPGTLLGHYSIVEKIGEGGMGEVYLADDEGRLERKVALKILPPVVSENRDRLDRFIKEAKTVSALNHPNILTIYEFGEDGGTKFIASEYVEGQTLTRFLRNRSIKVHDILDIAIQIAAALDAAHEKNVIHRDIKPDNVMVRRDQIIKVLDFGLAKFDAGPSEQSIDSEAGTMVMQKTSPGMILGTVAYMSPEQSRGKTVDRRTDIWSLGVVIYEMIAGRVPFAGDDIHRQIIAIQEQDPASLCAEFAEIPERLDDIVSKCLEKSPDDRYQTARDLMTDLKRLKQRLDVDSAIDRTFAPGMRQTQSGARSSSGWTDRTSSGAASDTNSATQFAGPNSGTVTGHQQARPHFPKMIAVAALVLVAVAAAGGSYAWYASSNRGFDSIAVLPFVNGSGDAETDFLSEGLAETLINSFTKLPSLKVTPRSTSFSYKAKDLSPEAVGRELKVAAVLSGRIVQKAENVAIQVDLIDVSNGTQIWGNRYTGTVADILTLQQNIAKDVFEQLKLKLSGTQVQQLAKNSTVDPEAYKSYLKGRFYWNKRSKENIEKAREEFQSAIDRDPNYALAYVGIADCYAVLEQYSGRIDPNYRVLARANALKALSIDDSIAEAHATLGMVYAATFKWDEAEREFKQSIAMNPNYPTAHHWYSLMLNNQGRYQEGYEHIKRARELDPLSNVITSNVIISLSRIGQPEAALEEARKLIDTMPTYPRGYQALGRTYIMMGDPAASIAPFEKAVELSGRLDEHIGELGNALARIGRKDDALKLVKELEEKYERHESQGLSVAAVYAGLGDKDQAFKWLEKDFRAQSQGLNNVSVWPSFTVLKGDPRFTDLMTRINLPVK
jgi:serine/threonine-protein kinase